MSLRDRRPATPARTADDLVAETLTAARPEPLPVEPPPPAPAPRTTPPPPLPRTHTPAAVALPRRIKEKPQQQRVVRHVVLVTPEQDAWMRRVRIAAIQDEERELPLSAIVRAALDEMRQRGGWRELRELLVSHAEAGPQRGRRLG
jgi:hypothetical protein